MKNDYRIKKKNSGRGMERFCKWVFIFGNNKMIRSNIEYNQRGNK